ncbi:MAG: hypothetical protein IH597_01305 [Bacteroidales bacterium]|nr:hypothetical protein [Bacteroidales bacterium]
MKSRPIQNNTSIKEGKPMKPIAILSLFAAMLMASCTTSRPGATVYDDVYYSPRDRVVHVKEVVITTNDQEQIATGQDQQEYYQEETQYYTDPSYETPYTESQYYSDPQSGSVSNYYYGDYYDYSYTSRLRRFHSPGFGSYYNDYYTNMYWYNYDPYYYGTSIYIGYGGYPSYYYGWGWPRRSYWSSWYSPYYMYGMGYPHYYYGGYSSYWMGYNHGYWDGYYGSYYGNDWYYNSNDQNSYYYGPRTSFAGNTGSGGNNEAAGRPVTFGERYEKALIGEGVTRGSQDGRGSRPAPGTEVTRGSNSGAVDAERQTSTDVKRGEAITSPQDTDRSGTRVGSGVREGQNAEGRRINEPTDQNTQPARTVAPNQRNYEYDGSSSRPNPGYVRPDAQRQQPTQIQRQPQPYSSPRYTKPKTSEEFTSPAYRNPSNVVRPADNQPQRQEASPSQQRSPVQTSPGREEQSQPRYTPPGRSNDNRQSTPPPRSYSPPTRSETPARSSGPTYTPPTRNNNSSPSYSAPSRSNSSSPSRSSSPSYSAPSRSSGSSSPPPSSSGSSGSSRSSGSSSGRGKR